MNVLQVRKLYKNYGNQSAVDGLDFTVERGDIFGFLGPNGAGKSTTIRMLVGLIRPSSGSVELFGKEFTTHRSYCLSRIGAIVEKPDFYKYLSAERNLQTFAKMSGVAHASRRIDEVIELVGLKGRERDPVKTYSHGMKQRLGLAQALLHDPELVILDEPTTGLDPQGIVDLRKLVLYLRDQGKTVFMSSHILHEVELVATRMVIISKGKAVAEGRVADLLHADDLVVRFEFADVSAAVSVLDDSVWSCKIDKREGDAILFRLNREEVILLNSWLCNAGVGITGISALRKLEEYFMRLTG